MALFAVKPHGIENNGYVPHLLLLFQGGFAISLDSNWIVCACFYPEKPAIWAQKKHRNYPVLKS